MAQNIQQRWGIKDYLLRLSLELFSRLGKQHYYTVEQVTRVVRCAGFPPDYLPSAHALFCQRKDFRRHYKESDFCYEALRDSISKRCFGGIRDFDAANIIDAARNLGVKSRFAPHRAPTKRRLPILLGFLAALLPAAWIRISNVAQVSDFIKAAVEAPAARIGGLLFPRSTEAASVITYPLLLLYCVVFGLVVGCTCGIILRRHQHHVS